MNVCFTISFRVIRDIILYNGWTEDEKRFHKCKEETDFSMASSNPTKTQQKPMSIRSPTSSPSPRQDGLTQPHLGCLSIRRLHMIWTKKNQSKSTIQ